MNAEEGGPARQSRSGAPRDIEERTLEYGVRAVRLFRALQDSGDRAGWIVGKQFLRSATSVGANVAEARSGESQKDFLHKLQIAQKEARESLYWLRLMKEASLFPSAKLTPLLQETDEIIAVVTAIIRSTRRNAAS